MKQPRKTRGTFSLVSLLTLFLAIAALYRHETLAFALATAALLIDLRVLQSLKDAPTCGGSCEQGDKSCDCRREDIPP